MTSGLCQFYSTFPNKTKPTGMACMENVTALISNRYGIIQDVTGMFQHQQVWCRGNSPSLKSGSPLSTDPFTAERLFEGIAVHKIKFWVYQTHLDEWWVPEPGHPQDIILQQKGCANGLSARSRPTPLPPAKGRWLPPGGGSTV